MKFGLLNNNLLKRKKKSSKDEECEENEFIPKAALPWEAFRSCLWASAALRRRRQESKPESKCFQCLDSMLILKENEEEGIEVVYSCKTLELTYPVNTWNRCLTSRMEPSMPNNINLRECAT